MFCVIGKEPVAKRKVTRRMWRREQGPARSSGARVEGDRTRGAGGRRGRVDVTLMKNFLFLKLVFLSYSLISITEILTFATED